MTGPVLTGRDIVCLGFADWDSPLPTNQHQLMRRLATSNRVLFVESLGLRRPSLAATDVRRMGRRIARSLSRPARGDGNGVEVVSPLVIPYHGMPAVRRVNAALLRRYVGGAVRRLGFSDPVLWAYNPQAEALLDTLRPSLVVYHCVDDVAAQKGVHADSFRAAEARFARHADLVVASSPGLAARMRELSDAVLQAPNVADVELFSKALGEGPVDAAMERLPRPRIVFHGALVATKLDLALIADVARLRPEWSLALVGPRGAGDPRTDLSALDGVRNIHFLGVRRQEDLPGVLRGADAGMIPYAINPLTRAVFPLKLYEYLAAGLPVVSTPLPALDGVEGVTLAAQPEDFAAAVAALLADDREDRREARSRLVARFSWEARIAEIEAALRSVRPRR